MIILYPMQNNKCKINNELVITKKTSVFPINGTNTYRGKKFPNISNGLIINAKKMV